MVDKPDIVKKLMEEEKLGKFENHGTNEKLEVPEELLEESFEDVSDDAVGSADTDVLAVDRGISDYTEVDEKIQGGDKLLQDVFDAITDGISVLDKEFNIVKVNQFLKDKYPNSMPLVGKKCYQIYQQRDSICPWCPSLPAMESGETQTETVPYPSEEKPEGWLYLSSFPLKDATGNISGVIEYVSDITELKKAEKELSEAKNHFQTLFNSMVDPVMILDSKGKFLELTERVKEITGWDREDLIGKNFLKTKLLTRKSKAICIKNLLKRMSGINVIPYEVEALTKDGRKLPFEINAERIEYKGKPADMVVFRDISDRKQVEEELRESEERFRDISVSMADLIWEVDRDGKYNFISGKAKNVLGYETSEILGKTPFDFMLEDEAKRVGELFKEIVSEKKPIVDLENWNLTKNGEKICLLTNGTPMLDENGELMGYRGIDEDITERKRTEGELKQKLKELETFYDIGTKRELKMIQLKKEINQLCKKYGESPRYDVKDENDIEI